ncbi:MAG: hypothetical protein ACJ797_25080 [Ktedonobacteraceae bacterium]
MEFRLGKGRVEQFIWTLGHGYSDVYTGRTRQIQSHRTLPKTISGKIRRVELREMERQKKLGK